MYAPSIIITKARESIAAAGHCLRKHRCYNVATSRSYYACLQLAAAVLHIHGVLPKHPIHKSIIAAFRRRYEGRFPSQCAHFQELHIKRTEADYGDHNIGSRIAEDCHTKAVEFFNHILKESKGYDQNSKKFG